MANKVPPGATAKEVADDIPIMASENEYIIPANVVRFIGLDKIEKMVAKARESLGDTTNAKDGDGGQIEDDELPFDPSELVGVPHMAEGGPVPEPPEGVDTGFDFPQETGYTGVKKFKNKEGQEMFIPFMNGEPIFAVPEGYTENEPAPASADRDPANQAVNNQLGQPVDNSANENGQFVEDNKSPLAGDPKDWSVKDFLDFGKQRDSLEAKAIKGVINVLPGGGLAYRAREKWLDKQVSGMFDQMLQTGLDPQGTQISPEDRAALLSTRESLKSKMSDETGFSFNPAETLTNAISQFTNFISGGGGSSSPRSSLGSEGSSMVGGGAPEGYTYSGGSARMGSDLPRSGSDEQYSGSNYGGAGNSDGSASRSARDNAQSGSGGLYFKGGLVTRP